MTTLLLSIVVILCYFEHRVMLLSMASVFVAIYVSATPNKLQKFAAHCYFPFNRLSLCASSLCTELSINLLDLNAQFVSSHVYPAEICMRNVGQCSAAFL